MPKAASNAPAPADPSHVRGPDGEVIDLKSRAWAAFLAWLIPGLGHWYQGRRAKAVLYFLCISTTFIWGMYLGGGRVVYAQWTPHDQRWQFFCQAGVGLPAIPAVLQSRRFSATNAHWTGIVDNTRSPADGKKAKNSVPRERLIDWFMAPPLAWDAVNIQNVPDELDDLHKRMHRYFDLGTLFTMVAGLLNILVIYDAYAGPAWNEPVPERKPPDDETDKKKT